MQQVTIEDLREFWYDTGIFRKTSDYLCIGSNLTEDMLVKILKEPKQCDLEAVSEACWHLDEVKSWILRTMHSTAIAKKAMEKKTGARALRCDHRRIYARYYV